MIFQSRLHLLTKRCLYVIKDIYACFIDYEKAFHNVQHGLLIRILQEKEIDNLDIRIKGLKTYITIMIEQAQTEDVQIKRGVRQGCILSPILFHIYSEPSYM